MIDHRKIPFVTIGIVLLNILGLVYEFSVGEDVAVAQFAMYEGALRDGEWLRLIVSAFIHFGIMHFGSNMICLIFFGMSFEKAIGPVKYIMIYIAGIIGSGLMINFIGGPDGVHAGASGAIWALMGATLILTIRRHQNPIYVGRGIIFNLIYSFSAGISWQGHVGGGLAGALVALIIIRDSAGRTEYDPHAPG